MISIRLYRDDKEIRATGFDSGDIEFIVDDTIISSREQPRFKNMIYLSIIDLIDGLRSLKHKGEYEFVAADSSFVVKFTRKKDDVFLIHNKKKYGPTQYKELLNSVLGDVSNFIGSQQNRLQPDDPLFNDFNSTLRGQMGTSIK
jgi:hypothetical protein